MAIKVMDSTQTESEPFDAGLPFAVRLEGDLPSGGAQLQSRRVDGTAWNVEYNYSGNNKTSIPAPGTRDLKWRISLPEGETGIEAWIIFTIPQSEPR